MYSGARGTHAQLTRLRFIGLTGGRDQRTTALECVPRTGKRGTANRVEYQIYITNLVFNACLCIVDSRFRAQRTHEIHIACGGCTDHMRALPAGKLDRKEADTTGTTQNQHTLAWLQVAMIEEALPGGRRTNGNSGRLVEAQTFGLQRQSTRRNYAIFRVGALRGPTKYRLTWLEGGNTGPDFCDNSGKLGTWYIWECQWQKVLQQA